MKKIVDALFVLSEKEIKNAIYNEFVRKFSENKINAIFSADDIIFDEDDCARLVIREEENYE